MVLQATINISRKMGEEIKPTLLSVRQTDDHESVVISGENIIYDYVLDKDAVKELFSALSVVSKDLPNTK